MNPLTLGARRARRGRSWSGSGPAVLSPCLILAEAGLVVLVVLPLAQPLAGLVAQVVLSGVTPMVGVEGAGTTQPPQRPMLAARVAVVTGNETEPHRLRGRPTLVEAAVAGATTPLSAVPVALAWSLFVTRSDI